MRRGDRPARAALRAALSARTPSRRRSLAVVAAALLWAATALPSPAGESLSGPPPGPSRSTPRLAGTLAAVPDLWAAWKAAHLAPEGRVVDDANGGISHSEGQGYGMLAAVAAGDREAFERLWSWTRRHLLVRPDGMPAWRWDPAARPNVGDTNDASDGTILIAWALAEAGTAWDEPAFRAAARRLVRALPAVLAKGPDGRLLLMPATAGFGPDARPDGPVVNLSYWVFPALPVLGELAGDFPAERLVDAGLALAEAARFGPAGLPSEWITLAGAAAPAAGFPGDYGYNALRVPLYLAWGGVGQRRHLAPFRVLAAKPPAVVDVRTGLPREPLPEPGYGAVPALVVCALEGERLPDRFRAPARQSYYPATLQLLVVAAIRQRYPACW